MYTAERARSLQLRLYELLGFVSRAEEAIGMTRQHVSEVLHGKSQNEETLEKLEAQAEAERQHAEVRQA